MKIRDELKRQKALEYRDKNSIVWSLHQDHAHPRDIKFCEEIINQLKDVEDNVQIIPFSVSVSNP